MEKTPDIEGEITWCNLQQDTIVLDGRSYGLADVHKHEKKSLRRGDVVILSFRGQGRYYVSNVKVKVKGMKKNEIVELIETAPFFGEVLSVMSEEDKRDLLAMYLHSQDIAVRLYGITATYDDTKKDDAETAVKILETAAAITVITDVNTLQLLKKNTNKLPKKEA